MGEKYEALPIIALTANALIGAMEMFLDAGMNDFISKPASKSDFNEALLRWLPPEKYVLSSESKIEEQKSFAEEFDDVPELDVRRGLMQIGGDVEAYRKTLGILSRSLPSSCANLDSFSQSGDMKALATEAHGLKGSLANLGASELSEKAAALERAGKSGDLGYCTSEAQVLSSLLTVFNEKLKKIRASTEDYDIDGANAVITEMRGLLTKVSERLDEFDYEGALELLPDKH